MQILDARSKLKALAEAGAARGLQIRAEMTVPAQGSLSLYITAKDDNGFDDHVFLIQPLVDANSSDALIVQGREWIDKIDDEPLRAKKRMCAILAEALEKSSLGGETTQATWKVFRSTLKEEAERISTNALTVNQNG